MESEALDETSSEFEASTEKYLEPEVLDATPSEPKTSSETSSVTTKTTLNPNADVFHSTRYSITSSGGTSPGDPTWTPSPSSQLTRSISPVINGVDGGVAASMTVLYPSPTSPHHPLHHHYHHHHHQHDLADDTDDKLSDRSSPAAAVAAAAVDDDSSAAAATTVLLTADPEPASPDDGIPLDEYLDTDQLRDMLRTQLEYYFSRENLANDTYLLSQMDADQYVPVTVVANFNQVKRLTHNIDLIVDTLRDSAIVQVDEAGEKVRPMHKRCIVILREIPESTPIEEVEQLFSGENCPQFLSCQFAHNNSWYVVFDTEEDAQRAYRYLREEVRTFNGVPIMARIKAKPVHRSSSGGLIGKERHDYSTSIVYTQPKYTYTSQVPSIQYIPPQSMPFFSSTVSPMWSTNVAFYDPGMAFAANGYVPSATFTHSSVVLQPTQVYQSHTSQQNQQQPQQHQQSQHQNHSHSYQNSSYSHQSTKQTVNSRRGRNSGYSDRGGYSHRYEDYRYRGGDSSADYWNESRSGGQGYEGEYAESRRGWYESSGHRKRSGVVGGGRGAGQRGGGGWGSRYGRKGGEGMKASVNSDQESGSRRTRTSSHGQNDGKDFTNSRSGGHRGKSKHKSAEHKMNGLPAKSVATFELEENCFPPLPGSSRSLTSADVFAPKISDVVRGKRESNASDSASCPLIVNCVTSQATPTPDVKSASRCVKSGDSLSHSNLNCANAVNSHRSNQTSAVQIKKKTNQKVTSCSLVAMSDNLRDTLKIPAVVSSSSTPSTDDEWNDAGCARLSYAQMALRGKDNNVKTSSRSQQCDTCTKSGRQQHGGGCCGRERRTTTSSASLHSDDEYECGYSYRAEVEEMKPMNAIRSILTRGKEGQLKILTRRNVEYENKHQVTGNVSSN